VRGQLIDRADEVVDVGPQLRRLCGVLSAEFFQFGDLLAQADLGVRVLSAGFDLRVEVVLEVGVALGERVAGYAGFLGQGPRPAPVPAASPSSSSSAAPAVVASGTVRL
jgi:hypothetical protein